MVEPWECHTELAIPIHLMIAMPKTGMDDIVRQATELGVASIMPVVSDRTILKPSPKKVERWKRIAQEAIEQCERQYVPTIVEPMEFGAALQFLGGDASSDVPITPSSSALVSERRGWRWICVARADVIGDEPRHLLEELLAVFPDGIENSTVRSDNGEGPIGDITIAVGPEGGWTPSEVEEAIALGYTPISLGPRILRAVTAPASSSCAPTTATS